jgi:outer membrane protein TolC
MLCSLFLLPAACSLPSTEVHLSFETPAAFSETGEAPLPDRWWESFDDPVLDDLIERALAGNLTLRVAWDRLTQARANARAAGASLWPNITYDAAASYSRAETDREATSSQSLLTGLSAGYELDLWDRIRSLSDAETFEAKAAGTDLQVAALTLSAEVATTWYRLVEQRGQLALLESQISTNERVLDIVKLQFRTGKAGSADVLQQRQLIEAKRGEKSRVSGDISSRLAASVADRFPRISLSARTTTSGEYARDLFDNWLASLAANLLGPLVDGGRRKAEVERRRAAASAQLHAYGQTILDAIGEVEDALTRETRQMEFIASLDKQLELAERVVERVKDRYTKGLFGYERVLSALLSHQQLERSRLTARRDLILGRISLCRALAGGWDMGSRGPDFRTSSNSTNTNNNTRLYRAANHVVER